MKPERISIQHIAAGSARPDGRARLPWATYSRLSAAVRANCRIGVALLTADDVERRVDGLVQKAVGGGKHGVLIGRHGIALEPWLDDDNLGMERLEPVHGKNPVHLLDAAREKPRRPKILLQAPVPLGDVAAQVPVR